MPLRRVAAVLCAAFAVSGCASLSYDPGDEPGFSKRLIRGRDFILFSCIKVESPGEPLTVYIEGDGRAWVTRYEPSRDPTPLNPLAMELAGRDPSPNVAYLARPGQYPSLGASECDAKYWMSKRFAPEVIDAMDSAVSSLKEAAQASSVLLVGYSGGAAVAVLVAARRDDVAALRTVCGNLDCSEVSRYNKVSPLAGSLDPIDEAEKVSKIPRRHFIASSDKIIPFSAAERFADKSGDTAHRSISVIEGTTHYSGWGEKWRRLLAEPLYKFPEES